MAQMHLIPVDRLRDAVRYLVKGFGSDDREIELVTENLIQANLTGHDSHGVGILPRYAEAYLEGSLKPNAKIQTRMDNGSMVERKKMSSCLRMGKRSDGINGMCIAFSPILSNFSIWEILWISLLIRS